MSGSSLDGLDIAYCKIQFDKKWTFQILHADTISYSSAIKNQLQNLHSESAIELLKANVDLGNLNGKYVNEFIVKHVIAPIDFIASHGHTIFHKPDIGFTTQIGDGNTISYLTGLPVIYNFRQADIAAGGQGAPLVPICDELFFSEYYACLNIGGIANLSFKKGEDRIGFDICASNQLLNSLANILNKPLDRDGEIARAGIVNKKLLQLLNENSYFDAAPPKSLDNNFIKSSFIDFILQYDETAENKLATATEHIALQIAKSVNQINDEKTGNEKLLITGGGAFNKYLISRISSLINIKVIIPQPILVNYKEALAITLMGILRIRNEFNFLPSVTGAIRPVCGGEIVNVN